MSTSGPESNREHDPDDDRAEVDRRFGEIVAGFGTIQHDDPPQSPPAPSTTASESGEPLGPPSPAEEVAAPAWREWSDPDEDDHFVPAATDPLPAGDLHFWGIVVGLTVGPLLIFVSALFSVIDAVPWGVLGVIGTVVGFVLLVLRSPRHGSGDDGSGARV